MTATKEQLQDKPKFGVVSGNGGALSREQIEGILKRRAIDLSRMSIDDQKTGNIIQLVVFSLGKETYGMDVSLIQEIQPLRDLTLIPCTPSFVIGAVNIRGKIISVINICRLFNLPDHDAGKSSKVMVARYQDLELGILADDVTEVVSVPHKKIEHPLATLSGVHEEYIKGECVLEPGKKMLIVLDVECILRDKRMIIHEEVG